MPVLYSDTLKEKTLFGQWVRCTGCKYCVEIYSHGCLEFSAVQNKKMAFPPIVKKKATCSFCRSCEYVCSNQAIYVVGT
jgi:NAD-dependent dihydropyrimidine dehydrogenase PreA subunit